MRIGVDVDAVLADLMSPAIVLLNERYGLGLEYETLRWGEEGVSREKFFRILDEVWNSGLIKPMEPMLDGHLEDLCNAGHEILIITRRGKASREAVLAWLHAQQMPYDAVVFVGITPKLEYPIEVLIDDHPEIGWEARLYPEKEVAVRDQPWNRGCLMASNAYRVESLGQFARWIQNAS